MLNVPTTTVEMKTGPGLLKILQYIFFTSVILYFGKLLFIPLSFAMLISFLLYPVCKWLEQRNVSRMGAVSIALMTLVIFSALMLLLLSMQLISFTEEWPVLKTKLLQSYDDISFFIAHKFHYSLEQQQAFLKRLTSDAGSRIFGIIGSTFYSFSVMLVLFILIPFMSALMLYYRKHFLSILYEVFPKQQKALLLQIVYDTVKTYYNFIKGMIVVYIVVAALNSIGLALLGIPHAILFGIIAAVLTFIPYVGIIIGSLLPIGIAWITYDSLWYPAGVIAVFAIVQYLEANVIFPLAVSNKLSINPLITIIVIITGGILWGAAGMILFVPFAAIVKLVADRYDRMKTVSQILEVGKA